MIFLNRQVGRLVKEKQVGPLVTEAEQFFNTLSPEFVEIGGFIQEIMSIKEGEEIVCLSSFILKYQG